MRKRWKSKYDDVMPKDIKDLREKAKQSWEKYKSDHESYRAIYLGWVNEYKKRNRG